MNKFCTLWFVWFVIWIEVVVKSRLLCIVYILASRWCHQWRWPTMSLREFPNYGNWSVVHPLTGFWPLSSFTTGCCRTRICQRHCHPKERYYSWLMQYIVLFQISTLVVCQYCIQQQQHPPLAKQPKLAPTPAEQQNGDDKLPNSVAIACVWGWMTNKGMAPITTAQNIDDMMIIILTIIILSHDDHYISSSSLCLSLMQ